MSQTQHYGIVYPDENYLTRLATIRTVTARDRDDAYAFRVECSAPGQCSGWQECPDSHEGMDPEDEDSPAFDQFEDVMIHGALHEWMSPHGWTVPYSGCPVEGIGSWEAPDGLDMSRPGRYLLDVEWDESEAYLAVVEEITP